jgi:iron complex outermembrane receptor protein
MDPWQAQNIQDKLLPKVLNTTAFIALILMHFSKLQFVVFIQNDIKKRAPSAFSQYSFEFTKESVCRSYNMQILKISLIRFQNEICRTNCWRFIFSCRFGSFLYFYMLLSLSLFANNIFNTEYTETNLFHAKRQFVI